MTVTDNTIASSYDAGTFISKVLFTVSGSLGSQASALKFVELKGTRTDYAGNFAAVDITGTSTGAAISAGGSAGSPVDSASTHWQFTTSGNRAENNAAGGGKPWDMIGPVLATSANVNPSVAGNHEPDFAGSASFIYAETDGSTLSFLTSADITSVTFYYGTGPD